MTESAKEAPRDWESAAAGWEKFHHVIAKGSAHINTAIVSRAAIKPGHQVLDVGCGAGDPTFDAAVATGPSGHVLAIDPAPTMLAFAKKRLASRAAASPEEKMSIEFREYDGGRPGVKKRYRTLWGEEVFLMLLLLFLNFQDCLFVCCGSKSCERKREIERKRWEWGGVKCIWRNGMKIFAARL